MGTLSIVSVAKLSAGTLINLTSLAGAAGDWAAFIGNASTFTDYKATGGTITYTGPGGTYFPDSSSASLSWTDGVAPTTSVSGTNAAVYSDLGFTLGLPAIAGSRRAYVVVGAFQRRIAFNAHLVDGSAADVAESVTLDWNTGSGIGMGLITLDYQANGATTLQVAMSTAATIGSGTLNFQAVAWTPNAGGGAGSSLLLPPRAPSLLHLLHH